MAVARTSFKVVYGPRILLPHTSSWTVALRHLLDHTEVVRMEGHAHIVRSDGVVITGIDLDLGVSMRRR